MERKRLDQTSHLAEMVQVLQTKSAQQMVQKTNQQPKQRLEKQTHAINTMDQTRTKKKGKMEPLS